MTGACDWLIIKAPAFQYSADLVADLERRMEMMEKEKGANAARGVSCEVAV